MYSSLANTTGHRVILNPYASEKFESFRVTNGSFGATQTLANDPVNDFGISILFSGCTPNTNVMNLQVSWCVEWTPTASGL